MAPTLLTLIFKLGSIGQCNKHGIEYIHSTKGHTFKALWAILVEYFKTIEYILKT